MKELRNDTIIDESIQHVREDEESYLFVEIDEVLNCTRNLSKLNINCSSNDSPPTDVEGNSNNQKHNDALQRLRSIFDKYLECPTLLDSSIEKIVNNLITSVRDELHIAAASISSTTNGSDIGNSNPRIDEQIFVNNSLEKVYSVNRNIQYALSALYALCKVRGRKCIQKFLPHGVEDLEPVWLGLQLFVQLHMNERESILSNTKFSTACTGTTEEENLSVVTILPPVWESLYMFWIWLSTLSLVPFDVKKILPSLGNNQDGNNFIEKLILLCQSNLSDAGLVRESSATCLAHWLSRPDPDQAQYMESFVSCSLKTVETLTGTNDSKGIRSSNRNIFPVLGFLQTCTAILKVSSVDRERLVVFLEPLWDPFLVLSDTISYGNLLIQRFLVKWWTRMGSSYIPPRLAPWRYQRGKRSLMDNLIPSMPTKELTNDQSVHTGAELSQIPVPIEDELFAVPDRVEDAIGRVIEALSHSSTIVRWSAAKGIGRITERLPSPCDEDVLEAILVNFDDPENDRCWHGACLALAELARRGLLLPKSLVDVVPFIIRAVHYDVRRGHTSVGSHVRDAGCYVYWAFARAYSPEILQPYLNELSEAILLTALFDREVNCRRAASAAFQEAVGRQGAASFDHGIDIITTADYFSLGNRSDSYLSLAPSIARFDKYQKAILDHLYVSKLYHWDENIRVLASKSLHNLTSLSVNYFTATVLPTLLHNCLDERNLSVRHGAVLGLAEVILAVSILNQTICIGEQLRDEIVGIVSKIEKKRLYRGRGGEIMRSAVCRMIECLCSAKFTLNVKDQVMLLDSVDANIPHPNEKIQVQACTALQALMQSYFPVGENGPSSRLQSRVVDTFINKALSSDNPATTRGYTLALGHLPAKLLAPSGFVLESVIHCLSKTARHDSKVGSEGDAETRRNSLKALIRIVDTIGFGCRSDTRPIVVSLSNDLFSHLCEVFLLAVDDYKSDRRGDVGSWCRILGMEGLCIILATAVKCPMIDLASLKSVSTGVTYPTSAIGAFLRQMSEKLDTVRIFGGEAFVRLISNPAIVGITLKVELLECLRLDTHDSDKRIWSDPSVVFPRIIQAASLDEPIYSRNVVLGLVSSIGGLTERVSNEAYSALFRWAKYGDYDRRSFLGSFLVNLLELHRGTDRLLIPILKSLSKLFAHKIFDELVQHEDSQFGSRCLLNLLREEKVSHQKDIKRLLALVDVANALWMASPIQMEVRGGALSFMCYMLSHPYPRVRNYTAEQMSLLLPEYRNDAIQVDAVLDVILNTPWSSENLADRKGIASNVAIALGVSDYNSNLRS